MTIAETGSGVRRYTAAEYLTLPQDEGCRTELVQGEVVMSPRPTHLHSYALTQLFLQMATYVNAHDLGRAYLEIDAVLEEREVRSPDIAYFSKSRMPMGKKWDLTVVPDLCVEVLSPWNIRTDRVDKFSLYERRGVGHYWIVDPMERTAEGYSLEGGRYVAMGRGKDGEVLKLPPFPELEIALGLLWHP